MNRTFHSITDLRPVIPVVRNQGQRSSCVAFAVTAGHEYHHNHGSVLSEEFLFRCCKIRDKNERGGTSVTNALENLETVGQVEHTVMPYQPVPTSSILAKLPLGLFRLARENRITMWSSMPKDPAAVEYSISREKPVISVLEVTDEFFVPDQSFIDYKNKMSGALPLHAVVLVGYGRDNLGEPYFILRNSWGSGWGQNGYAYISYQYYQNCWRENWVIKA